MELHETYPRREVADRDAWRTRRRFGSEGTAGTFCIDNSIVLIDEPARAPFGNYIKIETLQETFAIGNSPYSKLSLVILGGNNGKGFPVFQLSSFPVSGFVVL